ncbi:UPF0311 protein [Lachnellula occidentalis]|uniref:UPF0311 protein n=1 Tax=Lachnellula occidentalis TaxID=215460 RepID=A0A8H8RCX9_9HELO|nr:UPF0311 protein [Lachnellula occidentalis]
MDPAAYRSWTAAFKDFTPAPAPIPGGAVHHASDQQMEDSDKSIPPDTSWTVYSSNVTRGNFDKEPDNNPRTSAGWHSPGKDTKLKELEGMLSKPWIAHGDPWAGPPVWDTSKENEATPRPANPAAELYPHPHLYLPHPSLNLEFRMSVTLDPRISLGPTPFGHRNWISFTGGKWSGSWGAGKVLPGGQDSQIIIPDGSARLETNYLLETYDKPPAHIAIKTHGWRTGPPEVLAQLADPKLADKVDPDSYKFRLFIEMETGDKRYRDKVNCGMWVGSGVRKGAEVIYE